MSTRSATCSTPAISVPPGNRSAPPTGSPQLMPPTDGTAQRRHTSTATAARPPVRAVKPTPPQPNPRGSRIGRAAGSKGVADMQREHEEAMRADFTTYVELGRQMDRSSTSEAEIQVLDMQQQVV